ncbi:MAG: hypothetical protein VYE68_05115, partial [Acidobacteriota bacterium]|nr:hypothetical protein [Acidobacteriota bacterium]
MNVLAVIQRRFLIRTATALTHGALVVLIPGLAGAQNSATRESDAFRVVEATIEEIHQALQEGQVSCQGVVQAYVDRARAYNGFCTQLVTRDGAAVAPGIGPVRAGEV